MVCEALFLRPLGRLMRFRLILLVVYSLQKLLGRRKILQPSSPIRPPMESPDGSTDVTSVAKSSFGASLVIILGALLCSILCALSVSVVGRCRLYFRRWWALTPPSVLVDVEGGTSNIKKINIKALPYTVYRTGSPFRSIDCSICLAEFVEGEKVKVLPECSHSFHADCIDAWLVSNPSCPSCRNSLLFVFLKKPAQTAAETAHSARIEVVQRNESAGGIQDVRSFQTSADDLTVVATPTLDSMQSNNNGRGNTDEA